MSANDTYKILNALQHRGIDLSFPDANTLRRAELTLRGWFAQECGDGNDYASWAIERDEVTDIPYRVTHPHTGKSYRTRIPDREKGARARVAEVCARNNLHFYIQTDPRGCALYVDREQIEDFNYNRGVACCA